MDENVRSQFKSFENVGVQYQKDAEFVSGISEELTSGVQNLAYLSQKSSKSSD